MIRINLQKNSDVHKKTTGATKKKWLLPATITSALILAVVSAVLFFPQQTGQAVEEKTTLLSTDINPSTHYKPDMIEDVVREIDGQSAGEKLFIPYEEMSVAEQIGYELLFARNIVVLLNRTMESGIRLVSLNTDDFKTIRVRGFSSSTNIIRSMFSAMKQENVTLLPAPHTTISEHRDFGYQFSVAANPQFRFDETDPFSMLDNVPFRDELAYIVRDFSSVASQNGIHLSQSPRQVSSQKSGNYRKILYRVEGEATYRDFVRFVLSLNKKNIPSAFKKIDMVATGRDRVRLGMDILFVVKEL